MATFRFALGVYVKTKIEKLSGCIVSRSDSMTGCNRYCIQPETQSDGKYVEAIWTDEHNIEVDTSRQQLKLYRDAAQPPG